MSSAPEYFDPTTIARHLGDNWALKSSNLRKLLRNQEQFFHESLGKDADFEQHTGKVGAIARTSDKEAIAEMFELVAAAAVTCQNRAEFVGRIMGMSTENQAAMKAIIERSMSRLTAYDAATDSEDVEENELVFGQAAQASSEVEGDSARAGDESLFTTAGRTGSGAEGVEELERALVDARRELAAFKSQASIVAEDSETTQRKLKALVADLQERLEKRQEELTKVEAELRSTSSELEDSKAKQAELEDKVAQLADELDVVSAKAEQLRKAEATIVAYRKKLEGVGVMNQQMTDLEDQAATYLRQIMDLENDVKKIPTLQKTIDDLQGQVSSMSQENASAGSAMKGSASEIAELRSQLSAAESAKKMFEEEVMELRAEQGASATEDEAVSGLSLSKDAPTGETKEKLMRLEIENKKLQEQVGSLKKEVSTAAAEGGADLKAANKSLKDDLAKKEAERAKIASDKDRLEAYTKRTLAKFQEKYLVALQECKAKLKEKQDKIDALEARSASEKTAQKREERLLSSTIYELGLGIMQNRLKER